MPYKVPVLCLSTWEQRRNQHFLPQFLHHYTENEKLAREPSTPLHLNFRLPDNFEKTALFDKEWTRILDLKELFNKQGFNIQVSYNGENSNSTKGPQATISLIQLAKDFENSSPTDLFVPIVEGEQLKRAEEFLRIYYFIKEHPGIWVGVNNLRNAFLAQIQLHNSHHSYSGLLEQIKTGL